MKRVMIVGAPGSGKSTLARLVGERTGLPVHHMDHIHWLPGWQMRDRAERRAMALAVEDGERWIFEGGFSTTYAHRAERADTLIWLDLPVGLRMWRVTKRLVQFWGKRRPDMAEGCKEGFHAETLPFYRWIWDTRHSQRERLLQLIAEHRDCLQVVHLQSPAKVRAFLESLPEAQRSSGGM